MADSLVRRLKARHLNMIALGGSIGTGIFLASGYALHLGGPGGALLAYLLISIMVYFLITGLGEMATYQPTSGSFCEYSSQYVGKSFGIAMSYNYWFNWAITIAAEISAASILMKYWFPGASAPLLFGLFFVLILGLNLLSVKAYGESEYLMSFIKVSLIIVFVGLCCFLIVQKPDWGLHNFTISGGPFYHGWHGFFAVFLIAGFAFQGAELIGVSAGETDNPEKNIPKAVKSVFWRLLLFYILTTCVISLLIPFNDPLLAKQGVVASSPFTLVFSKYFGKGLAADIINFVVLMAVLSAANASMYASTRTLWHMGKSGQAPKVFGKVLKHGLPVWALIATALVGLITFGFTFFDHGQLFSKLVEISALCGFIAWFGIALSHFKFRQFCQINNIQNLKYRAKFYPYAPVIAMLMIVIVIAGQYFTVPGQMTFSAFVFEYGALIGFILIILVHKLYKILLSNQIN